MTRLQRFRAYMARMNPTGDPNAALSEGLYVAPPEPTVAEDLATRLELEPESTHLVLGGIGSGKTTELLRAAERLRTSLPEEGDHIEYCDVDRRHNLHTPKLSGVLVALAGLSLAERAKRFKPEKKTRLARAIKAVHDHAHGFTAWHDHYDMDDDEPPSDPHYPVHVPGAIVPPDIPDFESDLIPHLQALLSAYPGKGHHATFLFDSMDRLPSPERFREAVSNDFHVLKAVGIGVVVVGPIRFMVGTDRALTDLFDYTHFVPSTDPANPKGLRFLTQVLRRRADPDFLDDARLEPIARASGGVMRDLLALAKRAGEMAYASGHDRITEHDISRAIDAFGRTLAIGLDDEQVKKLRHLQRKGRFVVRGEQELSLLETRRVLLYGDSRFAVHPSLAPLLDAMPEVAA